MAALLVTGELKTALTIMVVLYFAFAAFKRMGGAPGQAGQAAEGKAPRHLLILAAFLLPPATRHAALGDMEEIYRKDVEVVGSRAAKWLMVKDILSSSLSALKGLTRAALVMALKAVGIYELYRRFIGR